MKALLVNGSPRQQGNTATALAEVARTLQAEGVETSSGEPLRFEIPPAQRGQAR